MDAKLLSALVFDMHFVALLLFSFVMCIYNNGVVITLVLLSGCTSCLLSEFNISKMPWNIDSALMGVVFFFGYTMRKLDILNRFDIFRSG